IFLLLYSELIVNICIVDTSFVKLFSKIYKLNIFDILKDTEIWNNLEPSNSNFGLTCVICYVILGYHGKRH
ncbi:hypothetical protein VIGAN_11120100, partial [Vigna angularis var. angularis]